MNKQPPIYTELARANDGKLLASLADQFGISETDAKRAVDLMMPKLTKALGDNIASEQGLAALLKALGSGNHAKYLDNKKIFGDAAIKEDGNAILGHLLGSKNKSRSVAARASADSGIGEMILRQILPYLASLLMSYLAKQGQGGGAGGGLGRGFPGGGGGGQSQDLSDVLNDLSNITRKKTGGATTHQPADNQYREISDVLTEEGPGNGTIAGKIRDTIASTLGGGGGRKGIIGWIISAIVWRYGWRIARYFLKRIF